MIDPIVELAGKAVERWYDSQMPPVAQPVRFEMNGHRDNDRRAPLAYNARPLNGIWATPPYLHNGSVPNLYLLLSPAGERPAKFYLGSREFDPVHVGYSFEKFPGAFAFDTAIRGNHNTGHEFDDGVSLDEEDFEASALVPQQQDGCGIPRLDGCSHLGGLQHV